MLDCQLTHDFIGKKSYRILSYESNDQCRKIMRGVSPTVFLGSHLASRWSNLESFIWYTWHLRSGHKVTYTIKGNVTSHCVRHLKRSAGRGRRPLHSQLYPPPR